MTEKKIFAERVVTSAVDRLQSLVTDTPELRSLVIVMDWEKDLNDVCPVGIWIDNDGPVKPQALDASTGAMEQVVRMLRVQQHLMLQQIRGLQHTISQNTELANQVKEKLDGQKKAVEAASRTSPADDIPAAGRPDGNIGGPASTAADPG